MVIGNLLAGKDVVTDIGGEFESSQGSLAKRMRKALKAGSESGGDRRGERSAALMVVGIKDVKVRMKVDVHDTPIEELYHQLK